jgi:hypothetical protein
MSHVPPTVRYSHRTHIISVAATERGSSLSGRVPDTHVPHHTRHSALAALTGSDALDRVPADLHLGDHAIGEHHEFVDGAVPHVLCPHIPTCTRLAYTLGDRETRSLSHAEKHLTELGEVSRDLLLVLRLQAGTKTRSKTGPTQNASGAAAASASCSRFSAPAPRRSLRVRR